MRTDTKAHTLSRAPAVPMQQPTCSSLISESSKPAIRHAEPSDYEALHQLFSHPQIIPWTIDTPFMSLEQLYQRLANQPNNRYTLVAVEESQIIGTIGLTAYAEPRLHHTARIGPVAVHPHWHGRGIGSALMDAVIDLADNWLNIQRLELFVYADNQSAIALYTKFGFEIEGTLRNFAFRAGRYVDGHIMARIRAS